MPRGDSFFEKNENVCPYSSDEERTLMPFLIFAKKRDDMADIPEENATAFLDLSRDAYFFSRDVMVGFPSLV